MHIIIFRTICETQQIDRARAKTGENERELFRTEIEVRFSILFGIHAQKNSLNKMLLELFGLFLFPILLSFFGIYRQHFSIVVLKFRSLWRNARAHAHTIRCIRMEPNIHFWLLFLLSSSVYSALFLHGILCSQILPITTYSYISWIESTWRQKLNCMQISNEQKKLNGNGNDYLFGDVFDFRPIFRGVYFPFLLFSSFVIWLQYLLRMFFLLSIYMQSKSNLNFLQIFVLIAHHLIKSNWDAVMRFKCNRIQVVCISFSLCTLCSVLLEFSNSFISHSQKNADFFRSILIQN